MSGILNTDRGIAAATYALSSLTIYWGCKRSVAKQSPTSSSEDRPAHHDYMQGPLPSTGPTSWSERCGQITVGVVCLALVAGLSHLIAYQASRSFQNGCFTIAAVVQIATSVYKLLDELILANSRRLSYWAPLWKLKAVSIPLAGALAVASVLSVYNGHRWIQSILVATVVFSTVSTVDTRVSPGKTFRGQIRWLCILLFGGVLLVGYLYLSGAHMATEKPVTSVDEPDTSEMTLIWALTLSTMPLVLPGVLLATTLQYEYAKAEEHENTLEIIPWRLKVDTTLYRAGSQVFYLGMILSAGAEILAPTSTLWIFRGSNVVCATAIPVVIRLVVLAKQRGVYEEYMLYPNKEPDPHEKSSTTADVEN